ncbi:hypothetical protein ABT298_31055 [Streptomyces sp. NPDC001034]|uniref:hypothetical protein n=1 Tax=Streptomyces sp. NPDC001034 TaxID=3154375 RepID=UPI00331D72A8
MTDAAPVSQPLAAVVRHRCTGLLPADDVARPVGTNCFPPRIAAGTGIPGGAPARLGRLVAAEPDGRVVGAAAGRMRAQEARTRGVTLQADDDPGPPLFTARGFTAGGRRLARTV